MPGIGGGFDVTSLLVVGTFDHSLSSGGRELVTFVFYTLPLFLHENFAVVSQGNETPPSFPLKGFQMLSIKMLPTHSSRLISVVEN